MSLTHAFDLLRSPPDETPPVVAIIGGTRTVRTWVLNALCKSASQEDSEPQEYMEESDLTVLEGETATWAQVNDDLSTASLFFSGARRTVLLRDADDFVSAHRPQLTDYVASPGDAGRLLLDVERMPGNTNLYKAIKKSHLVIPCATPSSGGRSPTPDAAKLSEFLIEFVAPRHRAVIDKPAALLLVDWLGDDVGMLDTEIARLAVYLDPGETITVDLVREVTSGWKGQTIWNIVDAAASGDAASALVHLDRLMSGGEPPIALLPQMSWAIRRLGVAMSVYNHAARAGRKITLGDALKQSGFRGSAHDMRQAEKQLNQLGRARATRLLPWLLSADLRLKSSHSMPGRDRFVLEEMFVKMASAKTRST
ncbi:MAG: DNA polymerase III subunit delta [Planctomycetota bacterium]